MWWKGHPPHRDRASSGVTSRKQSTVLQDTDVPPSSPRSCSGEGRGAGRQSCAGWRGGGGPSPPSHSSALSEMLLLDSGGGFVALAVLLLVPLLGFLQDRQGDSPWGEEAGTPCWSIFLPVRLESGGKTRVPGTQHPRLNKDEDRGSVHTQCSPDTHTITTGAKEERKGQPSRTPQPPGTISL